MVQLNSHQPEEPTKTERVLVDGCVMRSDEQVIVDVLGGNTSAFELLMRRHNQRLYRLARAVVGDDNEAEEVVQEAFVRAYGALSKFEGRSTFSTWMTRIAYHEALRSRSKRKRVNLRDAKALEQSASAVQSPVENAAHKSEAHQMITQAYDKLSATHRTVIMLRLVEGLSTRETSECMRVSESNVKVLLHRAKAKLVDGLEERAIPELREQFSFAGERCDRIVAGVFVRLGV